MMDEMYARLSKAGRIVCGRPDAGGHSSCDEPLADIVTVHEPPRHPQRLLVPLPGWRQDRKGVWRRTTRVDDLRARGLAPPRPTPLPRGRYPDLPALACCPKCAATQWLDPERLKVSAHPNAAGPLTHHPGRFRLSGIERRS